MFGRTEGSELLSDLNSLEMTVPTAPFIGVKNHCHRSWRSFVCGFVGLAFTLLQVPDSNLSKDFGALLAGGSNLMVPLSNVSHAMDEGVQVEDATLSDVEVVCEDGSNQRH